MNRSAKIDFVDTTLRDAPQSLWATRMTTAMMRSIAERFDQAGFNSVDLIGQPQFDACVRYLKENPWERIRVMRAAISRVPLRGWMRSKGFSFTNTMTDDVNALWIERQIANGIGAITCFDGLNDIENVSAYLRHAKQYGAETIGALAFSVSPVHTDELYVKMAKGLIEDADVDAVLIKDSGALLTVDRIRTLVPAIKSVIGDVPLEVHSHCTTGLAPLVYLEAVKLGATRVHTSVAPLAGGVAQPSTQNVAKNLRHMGYCVDLNAESIDEISAHFAKIAEREGLPVGSAIDYDVSHYDHQVPGGMISNYKASLKEMGVEHRLEELLGECARVRQDLGWPMLITPFAQIVGAQALLNVTTGERYRVVPDPVKRYALGHWGKLLAPVEPSVLDRIVENGSKDIPLSPQVREPMLPGLRRQHPGITDDELLLRTLFAGPQVDEMLGAGPLCTEYVFGAPVVDLIREVSTHCRVGRLHIRKGDFELDLRGR